MFLLILLACLELLNLAPKITTFLPYPPSGCVELPFESNPILYPEYLYLSTSAFFLLFHLNQTNNFLKTKLESIALRLNL